MNKTTLLALSLIGMFNLLAPAQAAPEQAAEQKAAAPATAAAKVDLVKIFDGKLVDAAGKPATTDSIKKAKYVAVYFSAHWCPPCRAFTPELVKFVNENRKDGNFEVVFVGLDGEQEKMLGYMTETKMPWNGVLSDKFKTGEIGGDYDGIPHLRVFDAEGKVIIDSVKDGKYVGPRYVLEELKKKL